MRRRRWTFRILAAIAVLYLYFAFFHPRQDTPVHPFFEPGPSAIAHRGGRGLWPENTLYAFERSAALGVDVLDMDVRFTADGNIVVIHDGSVDRTTDGTGRVNALTLAAIRKLDAGYRFRDAAGGYPFRGQGIVVPTLDEVLTRFPKARLGIEMKEFTPALAETFCRVLEQRQATGRVLIAAVNQDAMSEFRQRCPSVATSATAREAMLLYALAYLHLDRLYRGSIAALQMPDGVGRWKLVGRRLVETAGSLHMPVQVFTVNDESDMKRLSEMGVQGILSDYPDRLMHFLGR